MNQEVFVEGQFTKSIEDDLVVLAKAGFQIDYPNGRLGTGNFGSVYKGVYGLNVIQYMNY